MDTRIPSLRGEVLGADSTGPAVASRSNSIELGKFYLLPKRDQFAFRRPESTVLRVGVGHQPEAMGQPEERERRALAESILRVGATREVETEATAV